VSAYSPRVRLDLETERLTLSHFTAADDDLLIALDSDPAVMRFLAGGRPTPPEQIRSEVLPAILAEYERHQGFGRFAARLKASGEFIGWFGLRAGASDHLAGSEIGFRLLPRYWGRGYATEGVSLLLRNAFSNLGVERVVAQTMTVNRASRRVLEKAGLRYVRHFFLDWPESVEGSEEGDVKYALSRSEWLEGGVEPHEPF
jgi:RimJ/RimL family protein N-acetyltransferase